VSEERRGIVGLETEHVVLYVRDEADFLTADGISEAESGPAPPFDLLQLVLYDCLLSGRKSAVSSGIKGGYFLENGGLVHMEIYLHSQADAPILEVATPECRSPWDLVVHSRGFDEILEETSRRSALALRRHGFKGRIAFGKNNLDTRGVGFGCHENYLVHTKPSRRERIVGAVCLPFLLLCYFPVFLLFMLVLFSAFLWFLITTAAPFLENAITSAIARVRRRAPWLIYAGRSIYFAGTTALLYPSIKAYSVLIRLLAFRPYLRDLSSFLMTRQIVTGTGMLNFKSGAYELSQRAGLTKKLGEIVMFGKRKTVFDLKGFLFDRTGFFNYSAPLGLFQPTKKLSIAVGDSSLSDIPNLLKTGATMLVIEMIEAGESFANLRLAKPVKALKSISLEGPWKALPLRSGGSRTALEIQREYLRRAKAFFAGREPGLLRSGEILRLWEEMLDKLGDRPQELAGDIDWAAKKSILDRAVLPRTNWKVFFAWGRLFTMARLDRAAAAESFHDLMQRLPVIQRFRARRLAAQLLLDPSEYRMQRDLHFQARKIDLRYHELGGGTSYQRALEAEGMIRRITNDESVSRATKTPPQDTRARVRGYYIQLSNRPEMLQVNWNEIEILNPLRHIPTPDPFFHRLPTD
jgi:hypothetical protein